MRRLLNILQVLIVLGLIVMVLTALAHLILPAWFWHPLGDCTGTPHQQMLCKGYNSWSGVLGSFITNAPQWLVMGGILWWHHNCHEPGCWALVKTGKTRCKAHGQ